MRLLFCEANTCDITKWQNKRGGKTLGLICSRLRFSRECLLPIVIGCVEDSPVVAESSNIIIRIICIVSLKFRIQWYALAWIAQA